LARITLPERTGERNGKLLHSCAKDVERENFLWKSKEKTGDSISCQLKDPSSELSVSLIGVGVGYGLSGAVQ
jgi:hypothetical protein